MYWRYFLVGLLSVGLTAATAVSVRAADESAGKPARVKVARVKKGDAAVAQPAKSGGDLEAERLYDKAKELMDAKEAERAVKMYESVLDQYPQSHARFDAALALGKYYLDQREQTKAISYFNVLKDLEKAGDQMPPADTEAFLESVYLTGVAYFQIRQFGAAFPALRKITANYADTVWANQAYYYVGMCHFAEQNWGKAIEALNMVGTFVDPDSPTIQYIEAGHRLYVKVVDGDLRILWGLGKKSFVDITTARGDKEKAELVPLPGQQDVFIASVQTVIGPAQAGNDTVEVVGGDGISVRYIDENTEEGQTKVPRDFNVKVVSSASLNFVLGDLEGRAVAAFLDQPIFVLLHDLDLDKGDAGDAVEVRIVARYKEEEPQETAGDNRGVNVEALTQDGKPKYKTRDALTLKLQETGKAPVHSGKFSGSFQVVENASDRPASPNDNVLSCVVGDEIVVFYEDALNIGGEIVQGIERAIPVIGEIDNMPKVTQDVVSDPVVKARKFLVEGSAYLELARIFQSMGLMKGAGEKATEGLDRADWIIRTSSPIPVSLRQDAFRLKWELHMAANDLGSALATCSLFNQTYPNSPIVDQALMGIADIRVENRQFDDAIRIYQQVTALPKSEAKAKAQFRIAEITEKTSRSLEAAVSQYKACAERHPTSEYAGPSLAKVVDYYIQTKDYPQAASLLEQVFVDYPDAKFLDSMLLKSVLVSFYAGDYEKASERCSTLLLQYPDSTFAATAKQLLPKIEEQMKKDEKVTNEKK